MGNENACWIIKRGQWYINKRGTLTKYQHKADRFTMRDAARFWIAFFGSPNDRAVKLNLR